MSVRVLAAVGLAFVVACSSGSYAEESGTEAGPCYANGTCNDGLTCASNRCVRVDAGASDAAPSDAGSGGALDAAKDVGPRDGAVGFDGSYEACMPPTAAPSLVCGNATCVNGDKCCAGEDNCKARADACTGTSKNIECVSPAQCSGGQVCCAEAEMAFDGSCPLLVNNVFGTKCRTTCGAGELALCYGFNGTACSGNTCVAAMLEGTPGGNATVGVCF